MHSKCLAALVTRSGFCVNAAARQVPPVGWAPPLWYLAALSASVLTSSLERKHGFGTQSVVRCEWRGPASRETEELDIGAIKDFQPGELYEVKIHGGRNSVLVSNIKGKLYCTGNSCSHYSAPLHRGVPTKNATVACPWHDAEFSLATGDCINGPGIKSIPTFPLAIKGDRLIATVPVEDQFSDWIDAPMAKRDPNNATSIGLIGAGPASLAAAEMLRKEGFTGRIVMFGKEPHPPYDRPVLSKNLNAKMEKLLLRSADWLQNVADIELRINTSIQHVDVQEKVVITGTGERHKFDKILLATGGIPRTLAIPGSTLKNIEVLRTHEDVGKIAAHTPMETAVVIIGSSFIGMELAASLAKAGAKVTVVGREKTPFERVLGEKVGHQLLLHVNSKRVTFRGNAQVVKYHGRSGSVSGVELENGDVLQADLVILGVGVVPATDIVKGVEKLPDRSLQVNPFMEVEGCRDVFAAGDIATFPYYKTGENIRVEHWNVATTQGRIAAKRMMGKFEPYDEIPFFWTMMLGKSVRYAGYCTDPDDVVIEGDLNRMNFAALYIKDDQIQAVATCSKDPAASAAAEVLKQNLMPNYLEYQMGFFNTQGIIRLAQANAGKEVPS